MGTIHLNTNIKSFYVNDKEVVTVIPDDDRISVNHNTFYADACHSLQYDLEDLKKQIAELSVRDPKPRRRIKSIIMRF